MADEDINTAIEDDEDANTEDEEDAHTRFLSLIPYIAIKDKNVHTATADDTDVTQDDEDEAGDTGNTGNTGDTGDVEVQIRTDDGELKFFKSLQKAYDHWKTAPHTVSKISFDAKDATGIIVDYRFRPRQRADLWNKYSEARLEALSDKYKAATDGWFWIDQRVLLPGSELSMWDLKLVNDDSEYSDKYYAQLIRAVYTDAEFRQKFLNTVEVARDGIKEKKIEFSGSRILPLVSYSAKRMGQTISMSAGDIRQMMGSSKSAKDQMVFFTYIGCVQRYEGILPNHTWVMIKQLNKLGIKPDNRTVTEQMTVDQRATFGTLAYSDHFGWHDTRTFDHADQFIAEMNEVLQELSTRGVNINRYRATFMYARHGFNRVRTIDECTAYAGANPGKDLFDSVPNPFQEIVTMLSSADIHPSYRAILQQRAPVEKKAVNDYSSTSDGKHGC